MFSLKRWTVTSDACTDLHANEQNTATERESERKWIWMKGKSIRNTPPLNTPSLIPLLHASTHDTPVIFYSLTRGEFNKYMQMCAVEHDECKSGENVLWALPRLRLRADPGLIIFHFPIAFYSAASVHVCAHVFVYIRVLQCGTRVCASVLVLVEEMHASLQTLYMWYLLSNLCKMWWL